MMRKAIALLAIAAFLVLWGFWVAATVAAYWKILTQ